MNQTKRIIIAAGGSGGHIYPAESLASQLLNSDTPAEVLFVASSLEVNPFFNRQQFPYRSIKSGALFGKSPRHWLASAWGIWQGWRESKAILAAFQPHLVVGFGSYHTFPLLLAARSKRYPIALHEQNSQPGRVIRHFSDRALLTGVYFPGAGQSLTGRVVELAMPLRSGFNIEKSSREEAFDYFQLDPQRLTLLLFGGSQGSRFINRVVADALRQLSAHLSHFQLLHFTGDGEAVRELSQIYQSIGLPAVVKAYETRMDLAWRAADLLISRAGAGTIAEQLEFEVPGIYIPYPYASEGHQESNAAFVVHEVRGAESYTEKELTTSRLLQVIEPLLAADSPSRLAMRANLKNYKRRAERRDFASVVSDLLESL